MNREFTIDTAAAARHARFGKLPERIRAEDTTQGVDTRLDAKVNGAYNPEGQWQYFSCLALDLGL
ncbi:hypothetical protein ACN2WE_33290 [Streptomyces sp. cg28]|uniref:hypothetical protein n=1 Tax=unclassified Streptomyces TaxID=2593676 RepID=UPI000DBABB0E|nr:MULTISPECIES: hypothetical protein [unclassified Streptomyces]MYT71767.1 hypothetical protein [Streptomyces sp. SID8367]RAJ72601.1 hypothetical protein K377_07383 [Streptomyces sp. PsTaAH-137]